MLLKDIRISHAFIGSCEMDAFEVRAVAKVYEGRKIASHVRRIIVLVLYNGKTPGGRRRTGENL